MAHRSGEPSSSTHANGLADDDDMDEEEPDVEELQYSLGTLIVGDGGLERWLGATATSEAYLQVSK